MIFSDALQGYARYPINAALQTLTKLFLFEFFGAPECYWTERWKDFFIMNLRTHTYKDIMLLNAGQGIFEPSLIQCDFAKCFWILFER